MDQHVAPRRAEPVLAAEGLPAEPVAFLYRRQDLSPGDLS